MTTAATDIPVPEMPCDEIITCPHGMTNHAITVDAPPSTVWPWLVQMGYHRAG